MRTRPTSNETTNHDDSAKAITHDSMLDAVDRWLDARQGKNSGGVAESFGVFPGGRWRLYAVRKGETGPKLYVLVRSGKYVTATLPNAPETSTAELRARWCELAAPKLFAAWHSARATVVAKKAPKSKKH